MNNVVIAVACATTLMRVTAFQLYALACILYGSITVNTYIYYPEGPSMQGPHSKEG